VKIAGSPAIPSSIFAEQRADLVTLLELAMKRKKAAQERLLDPAKLDAIEAWDALATLADTLLSCGLLERIQDLELLASNAVIRLDGMADRLAESDHKIRRLESEKTALLAKLRGVETDLQREIES
jgi:septal ring factor EnvC (AmiA/AmiB activator)